MEKNRMFNLSRTMLVKISFLMCFLLLSFTEIGAQSKTITGTVTDESKDPLPGVSIAIKNTTTGTLSDLDGHYSIEAKEGDILEFSFIGMLPQTHKVEANTSVLNVALSDHTQLISEVVVVGYGSAKKADLTGAISTVSASDITKQPSMNAVQSVQGKLAGVNIVSTGTPGANPTMTIRGLGTAVGGRDPLYIVDGFPVDNISTISPSDIVSMNVLKDASSASIYGLRAANGVVMITTKKGQSGAPKISVDIYAGIKTAMNKVKMADASQYIQYRNEAMASQKLYGDKNTYMLADASLQPFNTNWYDELLHTGFTNNNNVSISGGGNTVDYFVSYNFYNEKGMLNNQDYLRTTIRNNNVYKFYNDRLKFYQTLNITFSNNKPKPLDAFNTAYRQSPLVPVQYANGRYGNPIANRETGIVWAKEGDADSGRLNSIGNPVFAVNNYNEVQKAFTLQAGIEAEFKLTDYLKVNSRFGGTRYDYKGRIFTDILSSWLYSKGGASTVAQFDSERDDPKYPKRATSPEYAYNSLELKNSNTYRWTWEGFVTFNKSFSGHNIEAVAGLSREKSNIGDFTNLKGYNLPDKAQYWSMNFASSKYERSVDQSMYTRLALSSYFGRVMYNYNHKYYFAGTLRRDGSSVFRQGARYWGTFPSFGVGWTLTEEEFMKNQTFLNYFKLRGTWGKLGNQNIPFNTTTFNTKINESSTNNYSFGNIYTTGATVGSPAQDLTWEVTRETSVGFDFEVLNNRLSGSFDYYDKLNTNALIPVKTIYTGPYEQDYYDFVGKISNRGIEVNLNWRDELPMGLTYNIGFNYSHNTNKMKDLLPKYEGSTGGSLNDGQITKRLTNNQPLYAWWMYQASGVWQSQEEIDQAKANGEAIYGTPRPGYLKYSDVNGDGVIDDRDKVYAGTYSPTHTYGINISLDYKNFDFSIDGYGVGGNKIYNYLKYARIGAGENIAYETFKNRWTSAGSTNVHPGADRQAIASTYYLESGKYFRINNITLGYTFKDIVFKGSSLRAYITAQNPFLFTPYKGFTPEIIGSDNGAPANTAGIERAAYPLSRNFLLGFNLQF